MKQAFVNFYRGLAPFHRDIRSCTTEALEIKGTARSVCALRQLISMHAMVYGVLTQPYTHMWCMSSHTQWHTY